MGGLVFICTDWYKKIKFLCVTNIEILKYVQNHSMKSSKMDKIQDRQVAKLKRVGHM
jgi:hypothetical protein